MGKQVDYMVVLGIQHPFSARCKVWTLGSQHAPWSMKTTKTGKKNLCDASQLDGTIDVSMNDLGTNELPTIAWECDSLHMMFHLENGSGWYITEDLNRIALPFLDINAMLVPVVLSSLAFILFLILVVLLVKECGGSSPERQRFHPRKSYASRRASRKNRNSALFVQNAVIFLIRWTKFAVESALYLLS